MTDRIPKSTTAGPDQSDGKPPTRWRLFPAILLTVIGAILTIIGIVFVSGSIMRLIQASSDPELWNFIFYESTHGVRLIVGPLILLTWGVSWLISGYASWKKRWRIAIATGIVGVAMYNVIYFFGDSLSG